MTEDFKYEGQDKKPYVISINVKNEKELTLSFLGENETNEIYSSNYTIDNLNEKFGKIIQFKNISEFKSVLINNINNKLTILKPPYRNVINSQWKIFPKDKTRQETFILISSKSINKNISLIFYSNFTKSEPIIKELEKQLIVKQKSKKDEQTYSLITFNDNMFLDSMYFLIGKYENEKKKIEDYLKIIKTNKEVLEYRTLLIFFDEDNMTDSLFKIINENYKDQIFIVIFTDNNINNLRLEIESRIKKLTETKRSYFDINNIFIYSNTEGGYQQLYIPLIKVYSYFNQLGDGFYKQLPDLGLQIKGLNEELKHLFYTHYFNILLCGRTGTGKSTFINKFMGEKKSFTLKTKSAGTYRNNFYIHKDYPIKIIDVCGFAEGTEAKENVEKLNLIYSKQIKNILIDEPMNDVFSFYGDKRNNIHLLLYFTVYNDKYDVLPGELPVIYEAIDKKIPIIFIVNKCKDEIFSDEDEMEDLKNEIKETRANTDFEKYETYFINCINCKGFDSLLTGIYNYYKKNIIENEILNKMKNSSLSQEEFSQIFKDSFFFGNIEPKDVFLNNSLIDSVLIIKDLIVKLAGYYGQELGFLKSISFYFGSRLYNQFWRNSSNNFFPLLTDLIKKIYSNFGFDKSYDECNKFIRIKIAQYFNIDIPELKEEKEKEEKVEKDINDTTRGEAAPYVFNIKKFEKDYINLGRMYWNSGVNFQITDKISEQYLGKENKLEEKIFTINEDNKIDPERILLLVKRDFGLDNSKRDATSKEKIFQKLFYISYTSNELISQLCGEINQKGFKYKSIYNFYFTVTSSYNRAINGFNNINDKMKEKEMVFKKYLKEKRKEKDNGDEDAPQAANDQ